MAWNLFGSKKEKEPQMNAEQLQQKFVDGLSEIFKANNVPFDLRSAAMASRSGSFSGNYDQADTLHQIYEDFGYPDQLTFNNYWNMYRRFGVARSVCDIPVDFTWLDDPTVDGGATFNSQFEELVEKLKLWTRLKGLDKRQRVGRYAGLFVRVKDGKNPDQPLDMLNGIDSVVSITPIYEGQLTPAETQQDPKSPEFGNPITYNYNSSSTGNRDDKTAKSLTIHHSRIIISAEDADDGSIYGISALEAPYNDLMDLRKICGAGGEGFYQNTRNAPQITTREGFQAPKGKLLTDLEDQIDEYLNKWRKTLVTNGLEFNYPDITLPNPEKYYQNSLNNISAASKIPNKILIGGQTGRLAADEDSELFLSLMMERRYGFGSDMIEAFINWCTKHKVLAEPSNLEIEWTDLLARSDDDKITAAERMAAVNEKQFRSGGSPVFSEEEIREQAGYDPEDLPEDNEELDDDEDFEQERPDESSEDPEESEE